MHLTKPSKGAELFQQSLSVLAIQKQQWPQLLSCSVGFRWQFSLGIMAGVILEHVKESSTERVWTWNFCSLALRDTYKSNSS